MVNTIPNHICRNPNCHKGEDGGPKHYYQCNSCIRREGKQSFWKMYACSLECYTELLAIREAEGVNIRPQLEGEDKPSTQATPIKIEPVKVEIKTEAKVQEEVKPEVEVKAEPVVQAEVKEEKKDTEAEVKVEEKKEVKAEVKHEQKHDTKSLNNFSSTNKDKKWFKK